MAMELLAFDDQFVADLAADEEDDNLVFIDIIQDPQVSDTQLEVRKWIGAEALDGFRGCRRLVQESGLDRSFQDPLFTHGQRPELPVRVLRDSDLEGRATRSASCH
jgi:hypothetical protein